jgi:hypothetical protein
MGENTQERADHGPCPRPRKLLGCSLFALFTLSLIFYSSPPSFASYADLLNQFKTQRAAKNTSLSPPQAQGIVIVLHIFFKMCTCLVSCYRLIISEKLRANQQLITFMADSSMVAM